MHRPVCVKCGVEMICKNNGVAALEQYAVIPEETYQVWSSDEFECPECGITILCGFGKKPYLHEEDKDFPKRLEIAKKERHVEFV